MSKHLTQGQRYHIEAYTKVGYDNNEIAKNIGVHPSTIGRELKRNSSPIRQSYGARSAHEMATLRKSVNSSVPIKMKSKAISLIEKYIRMDWSSEQVSATLQIKYNISISFVHIYDYLYSDNIQGGTLHTHLRFYGKKRRVKYGTRCSNGLKNRVSISQKEIVEIKDIVEILKWIPSLVKAKRVRLLLS